jgi:epoxyqueuosine reductase
MWIDDLPEIPSELLTVPGVRRDPVEEQRAFDENPLHEYSQLYPEIHRFTLRKLWPSIVPHAPRMARESKRLKIEAESEPAIEPDSATDSRVLTQQTREAAAALGITAIGVARYDEKYIYSAYHGQAIGDRIIVCIQEKPNIDDAPSFRFTRNSIAAGMDVDEYGMKLAEFLRSKGYRAKSQGHFMHGMALHFGVEAGLGQMGLNGQLLTPFAGSRTTFTLINTNAPLDFDRPRDYGILGICDRCRACVRRCPARAITSKRTMYRGVEKAKIKTARCAPVTALAEGCGVCVKVCPVQKYGLKTVLEEYGRSKRIIGRDTDELEGYDWPLDGTHYGPGELPPLPKDLFNPPGTNFVFDRQRPHGNDPQRDFVSG